MDQATFGDFADDSAELYEFDDYGPTSCRPVADVAASLRPPRAEALAEEPVEHDERENPAEREHFEDMMAEVHGEADDARGATRAVATDGGREIREPKDEPEPGDEVLLIENPAVGLNTSTHIITGEVSGSGKSVMIPESEGLSDSRMRLDASEIFAGESEFRDSTGFQLYTPGRYRSNQMSNYAPGPQAGSNGKTDIGDLPEPTHWPAGDDPDDAPDDCPMCGESPGRWKGEGKPRCERCGELVDPDADDHHDDDGPDKWDLDQYDRGDVLTLEKHRGEFLVIGYKKLRPGPVVALDVLDQDGDVFRLRKVDAGGGYFFDVRPGHYDGGQFREAGGPGPVVRNVATMDDAQDFEVIDHDDDRLRRWIRENYHD